MKTIKLNILAKDIKTSDYFSHTDCAISRALKRARFGEYEDAGVEILHKTTKNVLIDKSNISYKNLVNKVVTTYSKFDSGQEIKGFRHELIFEE